ncbi:MAG TPA: hypothetical protein VGL71_00780 [Urbifossiella sp.]|jgi:WD40 repeat protein
MRRLLLTALTLTWTVAGSAAPEAASRPATARVVAFSPDGKLLVAGYLTDKAGGICAWDIATREPRWHRETAVGAGSLSFSPDGKSLAVVHGKNTALLLDPATGKPTREVGPHPAEVRAVAYLPESGLLATGSDGVIRLWNTASGTVSKELQGHPAEVRSLVASPTGKWLISTGPDATRVWDVAAGKELKGVIRQGRGIAYFGITFLGPDRVMMADNSGRQTIRDLPGGKPVMRFSSQGGYDRAAYSPTAGLAAFTGYGRPEAAIADLTFRKPTAAEQMKIDDLLKQFDDDSYEKREAATTAMRGVGSVAEPALAAAMRDGPSAEVRMRAREVRQLILDEPVRRLKGHSASVAALAFSPDGKLFATGAADGTVRLWDPLTGRELASFEVQNK